MLAFEERAHAARPIERSPWLPRFDPEAMLRVLTDHQVRYVLIGGLAATLHGSPVRTGDADICPARDR